MNKLTIDYFLFSTDLELSQYIILSLLKKYQIDFLKNKIFPGLTELIEINKTISKLVKRRSFILDFFPIPVLKVDAEKKLLHFENFHMNNDDVERIFDLMKWAIPKINQTIETGLNIKKVDTSPTTVFHEN